MDDNRHEELMELKHEGDPLYRKVFYIVFAVCSVYLALIFIRG